MATKATSKSVDKKPKKSFLNRLKEKIDKFQQRHAFLSFPYSVQKKYGEDQAGYEAALVTYYGFLSLFPLLIVAMSITQLLNNQTIKNKVIASLNKNFPIVGSELQNNIHATQKAGIALVISIVLTLYGARGVASALQRSQNHIWQIPKFKRGGFFSNIQSLMIVVILGLSFIFTGFLSSLATASGSIIWLRIGAIILSFIITLFAVMQVYSISVAEKMKYKQLFVGSVVAAVGLQIVQAVGGFLITHELKKLSSLYGTFAIIFAILFWIYLQVRIILYGTEINTVQSLKLWPRSLSSDVLTVADKRALKMFAGRETYEKPPKENINVKFGS
jgi:membrane protein